MNILAASILATGLVIAAIMAAEILAKPLERLAESFYRVAHALEKAVFPLGHDDDD